MRQPPRPYDSAQGFECLDESGSTRCAAVRGGTGEACEEGLVRADGMTNTLATPGPVIIRQNGSVAGRRESRRVIGAFSMVQEMTLVHVFPAPPANQTSRGWLGACAEKRRFAGKRFDHQVLVHGRRDPMWVAAR